MRHGSLSEQTTRKLIDVNWVDSKPPTDGDYSRLFKVPSTSLPPGMSVAELEQRLHDIAEARRRGSDEPPKDGNDNIPAGYTYLGQFVIHDLTRSVLQAEGGGHTMRTLRTRALDLDIVYGSGGASGCPHLYQRADNPADAQHQFYLGRTAKALSRLNWHVGSSLPFDVPRIAEDSRGIFGSTGEKCAAPLMADDRNDEHLIISQLHALFLLVHNRAANHFQANGNRNPGACFDAARRFVTTCYRQIVLHDYMAKLLPQQFFRDLISEKPELIRSDLEPIPLEFVFGVARVGHAMARGRYKINDFVHITDSTLGKLLTFSSHAKEYILPLPADWVIDWGQLFKLTDAEPQAARRINPNLVPLLVDATTLLPPDIELTYQQLSFRDLWRPYQIWLPSGQDCARELRALLPRTVGIPVLEGADLNPSGYFANANLVRSLDAFPHFRTATPLSYYVAQEAALHGRGGSHLGPLGAYIFATTIRWALGSTPPLTTKGVSTMPQFIKLLRMPPSEFAAAIRETTH